jgi:light-regulated signal transduction histidine kinase (bacteriophytochrome)
LNTSNHVLNVTVALRQLIVEVQRPTVDEYCAALHSQARDLVKPSDTALIREASGTPAPNAGIVSLTGDGVVTACDLEPITRLERIQSFGYLLAVSRDWKVKRASANLEAFLGVRPDAAVGQSLDSLVDIEALHTIRNRIGGLLAVGGTERIYGIQLAKHNPPNDIALHYVDGLLVLEGEAAGRESGVDTASLVRTMMGRLAKLGSLDAFFRDAARQVRSLTGFDRVMVYRFAADGTGEVIAEALTAGAQSFSGLHFPAADIPAQARALYLLNPFRIIGDVDSATVPLLPAAQDAAQILDLSLAVTRAVSTTHIEYLNNMGVSASLSISIIVDGALWGMFACHNGKARLPTFVVRTAAELFGEMFSMKLERRLRMVADTEDRGNRDLSAHMLSTVAKNAALLTQAGWVHDTLRYMIPCDGLATAVNGQISLSGSTLPAALVTEVAQMLDKLPDGLIYATDFLPALRGDLAENLAAAAGLLFIPISDTPGNFLMLFRRERLHDISWAGTDAEDPLQSTPNVRLSPRKSFATFVESVRGKSRPFSGAERRIAEVLCSGLTDITARQSGRHATVPTVSKEENDHQELLIAELNHRVRNVLALIRGLISQTQGEGGDATSYVKSLDGRVQALARAHDRVTAQNWGPAPIQLLFDDEIAAYVPTRRDRFVVTGANPLLSPQAFSTLALVIHELVTNSSKYGSLSDNGSVTITMDLKPQEGLMMKWREIGGPTVKPPTRRGFGSLIIERVVPFDLQGTAIVRYEPSGFEAEFFIPERYVVSPSSAPTIATTLPSPVTTIDLKPLHGISVLLLEDNLIVAMDGEALLLSLGCKKVSIASTANAAAGILDTDRPDVAILDINLGVGTSFEFAETLRRLEIPFLFASGYSEKRRTGDRAPSELTVSKPYDRERLATAILAALDRHEQKKPLTT